METAPVPAFNLQNSRAFLVNFLRCLWSDESEHGGAAAQSLLTLNIQALTPSPLHIPAEGGLQHSTIGQSHVTQRMPMCQGNSAGWWDGLLSTGKGEQSPGGEPGLTDTALKFSGSLGGHMHLSLEKK